MSDISSKWSSAPASARTGFEHRAAGSCPVAKRMSENPDWIPYLRDLIYQLNVVKIQKPEISNTIGIFPETAYLDFLFQTFVWDLFFKPGRKKKSRKGQKTGYKKRSFMG